MGHRGFRVRWWMWVIATLMLLAGCLIAVRIGGIARFESVQQDLAARGLPVRPSDLLRNAPAVDKDRQARFAAAMATLTPLADRLGHVPHIRLRESRPLPAETAARDRSLAAAAAAIADIRAVLATGPAYISIYGWMERDAARLDAMGVIERWKGYDTNLLQARALMSILGTRACLAAEATDDLAIMRRVAETIDHPGTLIDAMVTIALHAIRDQTHLYLATRGRLSRRDLDSWVAEERDFTRHIADAFAFERCYSWGTIVHEDARAIAGFGPPAGWLERAWEHVVGLPYWALLGYDMAQGITEMANVEMQWRGQPPVMVERMPFGLPAVLSGIAIPNLMESHVTAIEAEYGGRLRRVLGVLAWHHARGEGLPIDHAAAMAILPAHLLAAASPNRPAIVYERLSPTRVRVGLDPAAPPPPGIPSGRFSRTYGTTIGRPAARDAEVTTNRWSHEVDLDAILIPPPEKPARTTPP